MLGLIGDLTLEAIVGRADRSRRAVTAVIGVIVSLVVTPTPGLAVVPSLTPTVRAVDPTSIGWFEQVQHEDGHALLCVGRLDGRVFEAARSSGRFRGAGPRDGMVLATWRDEDTEGSVIALIDTSDGSARELLRTRLTVTGVAFGSSDDFYYNTVGTRDGEPRGVYRRDLTGGGATRVADGSTKPSFALRAAVDGSAIVITDERAGHLTESLRVIDTSDRSVRHLTVRGVDLVGMLGDEVVVWDHDRMDALVLPLRAIAPDGTERIIADQEGWLAAIYPETDGTPVLVHDGLDAAGRSVLFAVDVGGTESRPIFTNPFQPSFDPPVQMIWRDSGHGVEAPGFVPVFPGARAYLTAWDGADFLGLPRLLVPLDGGEPIDLDIQPVGPPGSGCWAPPPE